MQENKFNQEETTQLPQYQPPQVITYTDGQILEELGPAQAIYGDTPEFNP